MARCVARAIGAVVARFLHTEEVTGSNPVSPTRSCLPGLRFEEVDVNKPTRRISSIMSLRKWEHLVTRGDDWFIAFGRLYVFDPEGTERIAAEVSHHQFPGRNGRLFRKASRKQNPNRTSPDSVLISGLGRFGNGVQQFVHARAFASAVGAKSVLFYPNAHMASDYLGKRGQPSLTPLLGPLRGQADTPVTVWRSDFFESGASVHIFNSQSCDEIREELRGMYRHLLSDVEGDDDTLTIHLRSGDVFGENPHPDYGQPPLSFYEEIIDSREWKKVLLIAEDTLNPCHQPILTYARDRQCEVKTTGHELAEATQAICESKHLIASRGTFVPAVVYLAKGERTIYQFETPIDLIPSPSRNRYRTISDLRGDYVREIMGRNWRNTSEQRNLMRSYPKEHLTTLPSEP